MNGELILALIDKVGAAPTVVVTDLTPPEGIFVIGSTRAEWSAGMI